MIAGRAFGRVGQIDPFDHSKFAPVIQAGAPGDAPQAVARLHDDEAVLGKSAGELGARFRAGGLETREVAGVEAAARAALDERDDVLFSPACASFDAYRNFEERARAFRSALGPFGDLARLSPCRSS